MKSLQIFGWQVVFCASLAGGLPGFGSHTLQAAEAVQTITVKELKGTLQIFANAPPRWINTTTNQMLRPGDRLRTGPNSKVTVLWSDKSAFSFEALTEIEILPPHRPGGGAGLHLIQGLLSFLHRGPPVPYRIVSSGVDAGIFGTEFVMAAGPDPAANGAERTYLWVVDGRVNFGNEIQRLDLTNGQAAVAGPGVAPQYVAGFVAKNLLQWAFYYPAVLDLEELPLSVAERGLLSQSITNYQAGDLLEALAAYPAGRAPGSPAERVYYAALLLSVGQISNVAPALVELSDFRSGERVSRLALALRELIAAAKTEASSSGSVPQLATELLAASYYEQSRAKGDASLRRALELARAAATRSPKFSFAWARVADLEFSFGRTRPSMEALERSLALAPRNAQALALKGFLLAARNEPREAIDWFNRAISVDPGLANAWLGRGLCRIRKGDLAGGREDLLIAAAIEPQRSILRSYLAKAWESDGDWPKAAHELDLAKVMDPGDPTPWLYSALVNAEHNRINVGIRDLERSQELNDNRQVFRSRLLLDKDSAVGKANLAAIYRDAGMVDWSVREAARAVNEDYANYSAHLFLANSYAAFADPNSINLRYETASSSEYLIANLLAPAGAGMLSPALSQQEYTKLFERDRLGVVSSTEYLSRGAWTQGGSQYGAFGNFSYSLEAFYRWDRGQRINNDVEQRQLAFQCKQQVTAQDGVYLRVADYEASGGDLGQYFDQNSANPGFRFREKQEPVVTLGYDREWSPGNHTVFLAARLQDSVAVTNPIQSTLLALGFDGNLSAVHGLNMHQDYRGRLEIYSAELQQIWQRHSHELIIGGLFQWGKSRFGNVETEPDSFVANFPDPPTPAAEQHFAGNFERTSVYAYDSLKVMEPFQLLAGVSYDRMRFPENFRFAPISGNGARAEQVSPKAGFIWTPGSNTAARFAYTRSITGASLDQGYRIEPAQFAGFIQSYRSIIPESVVGPGSGAEIETFSLSLEQRFVTGTYIALSGEILNSRLNRTVGAFFDDFSGLPAVPSGLRENLDYHERSASAGINQLLGDGWSLGAQYRISQVRLADDFPNAENIFFHLFFEPHQITQSLLHQVDLLLIYNHPSGLFARADATWQRQENKSDLSSLEGDEFWQFDALIGYRSPARRVELSAGILNLTGQNYRLSPLTIHTELPRARTGVVRAVFSF